MSFLQPYIGQILPVLADLEANFEKVSAIHSDEVKCGPGCDDCCHYPFDMRLVEACYVAEGVRGLAEPVRTRVRKRAAEVMEELRAKDGPDGHLTRGTISGEEIAQRTLLMSGVRVSCPALVDHQCSIYDHRPGICRVFGVPLTVVRGQPAVSCHLCGFKQDEKYISFVISDYLTRLDEIDAQLMSDLAGAPPRTAFRTSVAAAICVDYDVEKVRRVAVRLSKPPAPAAA